VNVGKFTLTDLLGRNSYRATFICGDPPKYPPDASVGRVLPPPVAPVAGARCARRSCPARLRALDAARSRAGRDARNETPKGRPWRQGAEIPLRSPVSV